MNERIAFFCIPAHGHTNPMIPVAAELTKRGARVRFYSFVPFEEKIRSSGAEFISCDRFLGDLTKAEEAGLKRVSAAEMTIQDLRITKAMDSFLSEEFAEYQPQVIYSDSVCFWGKLSAARHKIPLVISTSTFAFNELSSRDIRNSPAELADLVLGLPRISRELKSMEKYGYHIRNAMTLIASGNDTDTVVYTSKGFQPCAESFSDHYLFAGPSIPKDFPLKPKPKRPLIYISMGTVINERPGFYRTCMQALGDLDADIILSCGNAVDPSSLEPLPENFRVFPSVDQKDVLSGASLFLSHCGMNSVSESLFFGVPLILFPQTNEQKAVAARVKERNAGVLLEEDSAEAIRSAALKILNVQSYTEAAQDCRSEFLACPGPAGAAEFILQAPHAGNGRDPLKELRNETGKAMSAYYLGDLLLVLALRFGLKVKPAWLFGVLGLLASPLLQKKLMDRNYRKRIRS